MGKKIVSIVAPVYNEQELISKFISKVCEVLDSIQEKFTAEIILVDDGSKDNSLKIMREIAIKDDRLRIIELRRNYGQTAAIQAGMDAAQGDVVITLDADLQHFPDEIPKFLEKIEEGYDLVCGWRYERAEGIIRKWPSKMANTIIKKISKIDIHDFGTTFRAYRREIVKDLQLYGEFHRFIPALAAGVGARVTEIPIKNIERTEGQSKYGLGRTVGVFLDLFVLHFFLRYMDRPMRAFCKLAIAVFSIAALILLGLLIYSFVTGIPATRERQGWFLVSIMLFISSAQIFLTGLLAEFVMRTHFSMGEGRIYRIRKNNYHR